MTSSPSLRQQSKFLGLLFAALIMGGCAKNYGMTYSEQSKTRSEIPPQSFRVTFFRLDESRMGNRSAQVRIDDDKKFYLHQQSFSSVDLPAGKHVIRTDIVEAPFTAVCKYEISASQNEHLYFRLKPMPSDFFGLPKLLDRNVIHKISDSNEGRGDCYADFFAARIIPSDAEQVLPRLRQALD